MSLFGSLLRRPRFGKSENLTPTSLSFHTFLHILSYLFLTSLAGQMALMKGGKVKPSTLRDQDEDEDDSEEEEEDDDDDDSDSDSDSD